jgi:hypothetical protein
MGDYSRLVKEAVYKETLSHTRHLDELGFREDEYDSLDKCLWIYDGFVKSLNKQLLDFYIPVGSIWLGFTKDYRVLPDLASLPKMMKNTPPSIGLVPRYHYSDEIAKESEYTRPIANAYLANNDYSLYYYLSKDNEEDGYGVFINMSYKT